MTVLTFATVLDDLGAAGTRLRRAWPRGADHLLLDVDDALTGDQVAGQWFADGTVAAGVAASTPGARSVGRVVLQPAGADRRLTGLAWMLRQPGARLVAHRPERRAVVELDGGTGFAKIVPRGRASRLRHTCRRASRLPVRTPQLLDADGPVLTTAALPGTPLSALLAGPRRDEALRAVGAAVARLHRTVPPAGAALHGPEDELAVTRGWERWARSYGLATSTDGWCMPAPPPTLRVIHRDLHDGQFLLAPDTRGRFTDNGVGLLDFDLMAAGDPALDLANLVEHLVLRQRQGMLDDYAAAVEALLDGYAAGDAVRSRVACYRTLTARRLAAVYAFRATNLMT